MPITPDVRLPQARTSPPPRPVDLASAEMFGASMLLLAADAFPDPGDEWWSWLEETLAEELGRVYKARPSDGNMDRLMAAIVVQTTDFFWASPAHFVNVANALAGSQADPGVFDPATVLESAWAVTEAFLIEPPAQVSDGVVAYLEEVCREEGYAVPPAALAAAGVRGADPAKLDPEAARAARERAAEADRAVREELDEWIDQIASLPLRTANAARAADRLRRMASG